MKQLQLLDEFIITLMIIGFFLFILLSCKKENDDFPTRKKLPGTYNKVFGDDGVDKYNTYIVTKGSTSDDTLQVFHSFTKIDKKASLVRFLPYLENIIGEDVTVHYKEEGKLVVTSQNDAVFEGYIKYEEKQRNPFPGIAKWEDVTPASYVPFVFEDLGTKDANGNSEWLFTFQKSNESFIFIKKRG